MVKSTIFIAANWPISVGTTHIQNSQKFPMFNSFLCIIDLPLLMGAISDPRRWVGLSDYSTFGSDLRNSFFYGDVQVLR